MDNIPGDLLSGWEIVVVDDEDDSREVAEIILLEYGANVHTAPNGAEGLEVIRAVRPKFIISDLSMPVMDGWGLINALKADRGLENIPIIALTAHAMAGDRERVISAGFNGYLMKPLTVDTFITDITKLIIDIPTLAQYLGDR